MRVSFLGAPVFGVGLLMSAYMGVDNNPQLASAYLVTSNVLNLIFDYILLKYTSLSTAGASLSTVLGLMVGMLVFVIYKKSSRRMLYFHWSISFHSLKEALKNGLPVLVFTIMSLIKALGLNAIIMAKLGDDGMAVYTVCEMVLLAVEMVVGGIIGVIPNLAGALYGEKDYFGIRALSDRLLKYSSASSVIIILVVLLFPRQITMLFGVRDETLLVASIGVLRLFMLCLPFYVWNKFLLTYYESIEYSVLASIITLLQNGPILLPAAFAGIAIEQSMGKSGYMNLAFSYFLSEFVTVLILILYRRIKFPGQDYTLLPKQNPDALLDISIQTELQETPEISKLLITACERNHINTTHAMEIAIAAEEMVVNCIRYGGKKSHWIDLSLVHEEDNLLLRIRDNGIPFDPTEYSHEESQDILENCHGIDIVKKLATELSYVRSMDLNHTVLTFALSENS